MRFDEFGPDIPDALIEARNLGNVVFFCGAGVSLPALPDFNGLTRKILEDLRAQESWSVYGDESLDRVFSALVKEFGGTEIDRAIHAALRTPRNVDLSHHRSILDLSRAPDGSARIVTTNFDRLFERADPKLVRYVPPVLPDLGVLEPLNGLVYLHGRLNRPTSGARSGYIISSADFGRAYLAEGWAARFVRGLRERYTIVLIGYSANDPPMRYLLEGLSSRDGAEYRSPIYAFAPSQASLDSEQWRDKGVTLVGYDPLDRSHSGLWTTLERWAAAARDPDAWRARVVGLAQTEPDKLLPFERGQVACLVGTAAGARDFAHAKPPPDPAWLNVLDAYARYAAPSRKAWDDDTEVDPLELYGLDSDPPRSPARAGQSVPAGRDLFRWDFGDAGAQDRTRLTGYNPEWNNPLPPRLHHLASWIAQIMGSPATVAWAARNPTPHPSLLRIVRDHLDRTDLPPPARHFWHCYLEAARSLSEDWQDLRRFELARRVKAEGWTPAVLRELERIVQPSFEIGSSLLRRHFTAGEDWGDLSLYQIANINVKVTGWDDRLEVPNDDLVPVLVILRRSLERMAGMLDESTVLYWSIPTLHPTGERGEARHHGRKAGHIIRFARLFDRLAAIDPEKAIAELSAWPRDENRYFSKLFLYAASKADLVPPLVFAERILSMPAETFWTSEHQREMLFALRARWMELGERDRDKIVSRVAEGPVPEADGAEDRQRNASRAASWLRWLELHGRPLSKRAAATLRKLQAQGLKEWDDSWAWQADDSHGPWGGTVARVTEPQGLETLRAWEVVEAARRLSTDDHRALRDYRPFDGLVKIAPRKALAALRIEARISGRPRDFWESLISNWPEEAGARATLLLSATLARLPQEQFIQHRFAIARFCSGSLSNLPKPHQSIALRAFDAIVDRYAASQPPVLASSVHSTTHAGQPVAECEYTLMKSINAPACSLCDALFNFLGPRKRRGPMPRKISQRLDRLMTLPGDGGRHAASYIARRFSWLEYWHADFTSTLLDRFQLGDPVAPGLWSGLAGDRNLLTVEADTAIKPAMLALLRGEREWPFGDEEGQALVDRMVWLTGPGRGRGVVAYEEARDVLIAISDEDREHALSALARAGDKAASWKQETRPFLKKAWPRQLRYQTSSTSAVLLQIVEKVDDDFPDAVSVLTPFLRPVENFDTFAYRLSSDDPDGRDYVSRYPRETLALFDRVIGPATSHWDLGQLLERMVEAEPNLRHDDRWRRLRAASP